VAFPEWKAVEKLPWWGIAMVGAVAVSLVFFVAAVVLIGSFPGAGR
jgi:hypothetical protein